MLPKHGTGVVSLHPAIAYVVVVVRRIPNLAHKKPPHIWANACTHLYARAHIISPHDRVRMNERRVPSTLLTVKKWEKWVGKKKVLFYIATS